MRYCVYWQVHICDFTMDWNLGLWLSPNLLFQARHLPISFVLWVCQVFWKRAYKQVYHSSGCSCQIFSLRCQGVKSRELQRKALIFNSEIVLRFLMLYHTAQRTQTHINQFFLNICFTPLIGVTSWSPIETSHTAGTLLVVLWKVSGKLRLGGEIRAVHNSKGSSTA